MPWEKGKIKKVLPMKLRINYSSCEIKLYPKNCETFPYKMKSHTFLLLEARRARSLVIPTRRGVGDGRRKTRNNFVVACWLSENCLFIIYQTIMAPIRHGLGIVVSHKSANDMQPNNKVFARLSKKIQCPYLEAWERFGKRLSGQNQNSISESFTYFKVKPSNLLKNGFHYQEVVRTNG